VHPCLAGPPPVDCLSAGEDYGWQMLADIPCEQEPGETQHQAHQRCGVPCAACDHQATQMWRELGLLGVPSYVDYIHGSTDWYILDEELPIWCEVHQQEEPLLLWMGGAWNSWEGVCAVEDGSPDTYKWYAVWPHGATETAPDMLTWLLEDPADYQAWTYEVLEGDVWYIYECEQEP